MRLAIALIQPIFGRPSSLLEHGASAMVGKIMPPIAEEFYQ